VPVFSFGENDVFVQLLPNPEGTTIRKWQNAMKKALGFTLPIVMGRGVFNYDFGFLPLRKPIVSIGAWPAPFQHALERGIHIRRTDANVFGF